MNVATDAMNDLLDQLADAEAMLLEPQEFFNKALIGIAQRADGIIVAAYDSEKCIAALREQNNWDYDEAQEWFEFNVQGGYVGPHSPMFVDVWILE